MVETKTSSNKRKESTPPEGYSCNICNETGHWIQQCTQKKRKKQKKLNKDPTHIHIPGVDPSQEDISKARDLQKIKPPKCFCRQTSRLKKVKKSKAGGESSRAIGKYFFFCSKARDDESKCKFARPVDDELKSKKDRICTFFAKSGFCKKGDKCMFSHDLTKADGKVTNVSSSENVKAKEQSTESLEKAENVTEMPPDGENVSNPINADKPSSSSDSSSISSSDDDDSDSD